ncbi:MAG: hypothetical protein LUI39_00760 [Lachnospiraceae bacterium]|nr:hypothetical protein [Lachnospiraceae bacterium]
MQFIKDQDNHKIVVLPEIIFKNKHNIDWHAVEQYLKKYVGEFVTIAETNDIVYIGKEFPDEYKGSKYTRRLKGTNAKVKANAAQAIMEMLEIATEKIFHENKKDKHSFMAGNGWYYYKTWFAIPTCENERKTDLYHIYSARLLVNCTAHGKLYLYDLLDIKKEASNPLKNYTIL